MTGIIGATGNFQKKNTTPKALLAAADLMDKGADQQGIVRWLYKTQPLAILKLLGRVMSKLNWEEKTKLAWANLTLEDFVQSRNTPESLPIILEKLQENYSDGQIFMLLYNDTPVTTLAFIRISDIELLRKLATLFNVPTHAEFLKIKLPESDLSLVAKIIQDKIENI